MNIREFLSKISSFRGDRSKFQGFFRFLETWKENHQNQKSCCCLQRNNEQERLKEERRSLVHLFLLSSKFLSPTPCICKESKKGKGKSRLSEKVEEIHFILSASLISRLFVVSGTEQEDGRHRERKLHCLGTTQDKAQYRHPGKRDRTSKDHAGRATSQSIISYCNIDQNIYLPLKERNTICA